MSSTPAKHYLVARVLLMSNQRQSEPSHTDGQIAEALSISRRTVICIKQRFVQENLEVALVGNFPRERPERRCLDGKVSLTTSLLLKTSASKLRAGKNIATSGLARSTGSFARRMHASNSSASIQCSNLMLSLLGLSCDNLS